MSYEATFTRGFQNGLERLPRDFYPIVQKQMERIKNDPFAKNPTAKRIKNGPRQFRVRIGNVRMIYRVVKKPRRIEFFRIAFRDHAYNQLNPGGSTIPEEQISKILEGNSKKSEAIASPSPGESLPKSVYTIPTDADVEIDEVTWITEDDLFLLQVPDAIWPTILEADSIEGLQKSGVDASIASRIEDYWTNPRPTQVEKLYTISEGQGVQAIADEPLSHFLIALDPEQKAALEKIKLDGPYLLKGSAGTGKSLVGLYHIRDLINSGACESLFDDSQPSFGVLTYTNTLVDTSRKVLQSITPAAVHSSITCTTLDKLVYNLAARTLKQKPSLLGEDGISNCIRDDIRPNLQSAATGVLDRLGPDYVANEIEHAIFGNGLTSLNKYLDMDRRGRKHALRGDERKTVWEIYEAFKRLSENRNKRTYAWLRFIALRYLQDHPQYPRFTALFVDEAQDFPKVARQLCLELVKAPKYLVLASDSGQSIYTFPVSWRQTDPRFDFRRRRPIMMERSYRTTTQIGQAVAALRRDPGDEDDHSADASPVFSGPKPRWIDAPLQDHPKVVCGEIDMLVKDKQNPINASQIAIIVRINKDAEKYKRALWKQGVSSVIVKDKSFLDTEGNHVHIITAHSSKGLGFPFLFVPGLHEDVYPLSALTTKALDSQHREQMVEGEQRLLYVALTRASYRLYVVVDPAAPSPFVCLLDRSSHWD